MPKYHGTVSVDGQYTEFQSAVLRALPRVMDHDVAASWSKKGKLLARLLGEILVPSKFGCTVFVDYARSIEDGIDAGRYDIVDPIIRSAELKPQNRRGLINIEFIDCGQELPRSVIEVCLADGGYRPIDLQELLALGEVHLNLQIECPIVALGSDISRRGSEQKMAAYLVNDSNQERHLLLRHFEEFWGRECRFAAVHK